jgi:hypothetical protein
LGVPALNPFDKLPPLWSFTEADEMTDHVFGNYRQVPACRFVRSEAASNIDAPACRVPLRSTPTYEKLHGAATLIAQISLNAA